MLLLDGWLVVNRWSAEHIVRTISALFLSVAEK